MLKRTLMFFLLVIILPFPSIVKADKSDLKAAFIRDDNLWIKKGKEETRITSGAYIRYPKWSADGNWIAYLKGKQESDLWLYSLRDGHHVKIKSKMLSSHYQWSPKGNKLGFIAIKDLFVVEPDSSLVPKPIAANVQNFSWLPDENGLLISFKKDMKLNSDIYLSKYFLDTKEVRPFFTVPVDGNEIVVSTSQFKWSHDHKWLSFLLVPTASVSADSNTLCILSSDGKVFKRIDEMLNYEDWFEWAPSGGRLGYISGIGREALFRKKLKTVEAPGSRTILLTPQGFADRGLAWATDDILFASRAKESKWTGDSTKRPMPGLYVIKMSTHLQKKITSPLGLNGDFAPDVIGDRLIWIRSDRKRASVYFTQLAVPKIKEEQWIKNIDVSSSYYEKWYWDEVFSLYQRE